MEAKKKLSPAAAAAAAAAGAGAASPPPNGYFSSVFPSPPAGNAKDAKQSDLYAMLNKQSSRGQNGSSITDSKSNGRATYKDGKHVCQNESSESPYFGSSVHYGGREFYSSSAQKQPANEPPRNYKEDNLDGSATRGDWWQGIKGVALVVALGLLILSLQASKIIVGSWRRDYIRPVGGGSI